MGSEAALRLALGLLALIGLGIAAYLTIVHYEGGDPVCLVGGEGCSKVQDSEYATLAGVPVPVIGIVGYLSVLLAALIPNDPGRFLGVFAGLVGFGFSIYLTYLELFEIDAICNWCIASAVVMALALVVALIRALRFGGLDAPSGGKPDPETKSDEEMKGEV
jgi:uncharacterized membrane protein